ncbi:hypothetical protein Rxycam_02005 [Rubrobacter xylanophilus DSM 9941]|uniref:Cupin n=1 Tax=Rubrobacter xylanophilus TaxID=49319 RepID=A0A510HKL1_9ACTN|nr:cupin domain-containing protein [Rubrobacter xylanophilus]QYJ16174.1 hypothetical protein Rxycam_02005 [Rubrobacter xylanophilus DSM 9941]BBL80550.1 cupin [Rubrobacter xylanophilus]
METQERGVTHRAAGEGRAFWILGEMLVEFKATGAETGGAYSAFELTTQPEGGPPPHKHRDDEGFYVLEGRFEFPLGEGTVEAGPGSFVHIPGGTVHTFRCVGTAPGRLLVTASPAGPHERFFAEIGEPATDRTSPPAHEGPPDVEGLVTAAARHGIEILPPS